MVASQHGYLWSYTSVILSIWLPSPTITPTSWSTGKRKGRARPGVVYMIWVHTSHRPHLADRKPRKRSLQLGGTQLTSITTEEKKDTDETMNWIGLSVKSLVYFSERFGLKYDGEIMSPSHGRVLCMRVKHYELPVGLWRGSWPGDSCNCQKKGFPPWWT